MKRGKYYVDSRWMERLRSTGYIERRETGTLGRLSSGAPGPAGDLRYKEGESRLEKEERSLSQKQQRRRRMGIFQSAPAVEHSI